MKEIVKKEQKRNKIVTSLIKNKMYKKHEPTQTRKIERNILLVNSQNSI